MHFIEEVELAWYAQKYNAGALSAVLEHGDAFIFLVLVAMCYNIYCWVLAQVQRWIRSAGRAKHSTYFKSQSNIFKCCLLLDFHVDQSEVTTSCLELGFEE